MNKVFRLVLMICTLSVLLCSTCFAFEKVQMNDTLDVRSVNSTYNHNMSNAGKYTLMADNFRYIGPRDDYEIYANLLTDSNIIEYICNKAGYVDGVVIVSDNIQTNIDESSMILSILTNGYDKIYIDDVISKSANDLKSWNIYCEPMNRAYNVYTTSHNKFFTTVMSAFIK